MGRTLGDDFDEDDILGGGGSLDLEKGQHAGAGGPGAASANYDGGRDFGDDPFADEESSGPLELDLPTGSATALRAASSASVPPTLTVPDLALAPPAARPSGSMAAVRPSGSMAAVRSLKPPVAAPPVTSVAPASQDQPGAAPLSHGEPTTSHGAPMSPSSPESPAAPARPTAAAVIAQYPDPPAEMFGAPRYAVRVLLRQLELRSELESLRRRRSPDVPLYESALKAYDPKTFRLGMALNTAILAVAMFIFCLPVILRFMRAD